MQLLQRSFGVVITLPLLFFFVESAFSRQTVVTGSAGFEYDFRERSYDQDQADFDGNEGDTQKASIGPTIAVTSEGIYDTLDFLYSPKIAYDFVDDTNEVDQQLSLLNKRFLTKRWSLTLSDDFVMTNDPDPYSRDSNYVSSTEQSEQQGITSQDILSRDLSGRQYWTNTAGVRSSYAFAEKSSIGGGYNYSLLRNESSDNEDNIDDYEEYDKHDFFTDLSYQINQNWRSSLGLNYIRGLYDQEEQEAGLAGTQNTTPDLDQYGALVGVDYIQSQSDLYPLKYSFYQTDYDGDTRRGSEVHEWSAGWDHTFDPQTRLALGAGPSYAKTEGLDGQWGYNAYCAFTKKYQHASYALLFDKRYMMQNFTGTGDSGLTDTYNLRANFTYQYTESLGFDLFGRYAWESNLDPQGEYRDFADGITVQETGDISYDTDIYEAGVGLRYSFAQWYTAGIQYVYYVSDGNLDSDQYTDHQVLFTLSATKEIWRW